MKKGREEGEEKDRGMKERRQEEREKKVKERSRGRKREIRGKEGGKNERAFKVGVSMRR